GWSAVGQHDLAKELIQVLHISVKARDMPGQWIAQEPARCALSTPVESHAAEAKLCQVLHRLKILFGRLITALQQDGCAVGCVGRQPCITQVAAVFSLDLTGEETFRDWVFWNFTKKAGHENTGSPMGAAVFCLTQLQQKRKTVSE